MWELSYLILRSDRAGPHPRLTPEQLSQPLPGLAVQDGTLLQSGASRLIEAAPDQVEFPCAVRIGGDGDHDARRRRASCILSRQVQPVRTGIDLEETSVLPRML